MTKVYVVRHGETEGNYYGRVSGFYDTHLTGRGLKQIACLTKRFENEKIDAVYSSNRDRAIKTAQAVVAGKGLEVNITPRLGECSLGNWDNKCWGELSYFDTDNYRQYFTSFINWHSENSEHISDLKARMIGLVRELAEKHDGQNIVLVSHGHAIRALLCEITGVPDDQVNTKGYGGNAAVSLLRVENGVVTLEYESDMSHIIDAVDEKGRPLIRPRNLSGGDRNFNVYSEPLDLEKYRDYYLSVRRKVYEAEHGNIKGFDEEAFFETAMERYRKSPDSLLLFKHRDELAGIVEMDTRRDAEHGYGWVDLYFLEDKYKGSMAYMHPFGQIISYYRIINRTELRMEVAKPTPEQAEFYEEHDIYTVSTNGDTVILGYNLYM